MEVIIIGHQLLKNWEWNMSGLIFRIMLPFSILLTMIYLQTIRLIYLLILNFLMKHMIMLMLMLMDG